MTENCLFALTPTNGGLVSPLYVCLCRRHVEIVMRTFDRIRGNKAPKKRVWRLLSPFTFDYIPAVCNWVVHARFEAVHSSAAGSHCAVIIFYDVWSIFCLNCEQRSPRAINYFGAVIILSNIFALGSDINRSIWQVDAAARRSRLTNIVKWRIKVTQQLAH